MYLESGAVQGMILHIGNPLGAETASNVVLSAFPENALGHAVRIKAKILALIQEEDQRAGFWMPGFVRPEICHDQFGHGFA